MTMFRLTLGSSQREALAAKVARASKMGDTRTMIRALAILALAGPLAEKLKEAASCYGINVRTVQSWLSAFLLKGVASLEIKKSPGRPPKLTKRQKEELARLIDEGPSIAGFLGNCWRSPMIQMLIKEQFGVTYSAFYIPELLKNMGFSYQRARFIYDQDNEEERARWIAEKWPEILALGKEKKSYILFGDEASFPQWGTLSYTWARVGKQPVVRTSGRRKGYKVFGFIDYFTGKFFFKGQDEKLNSETYIRFLKEVLSRTRKHTILIHDNAPYHKSVAVQNFLAKNSKRLRVYRLPPYSPDYNPIEQLWKKIKKEGTHMQFFPDFESLCAKVEETLLYFKDAPSEVLSLFGFYRNLELARP